MLPLVVPALVLLMVVPIFFAYAGAPPPGNRDHDPTLGMVGVTVPYAELFNATASLGIDPRLVAAVARHESMDFDPDVIECRTTSPKGAEGIMQIMPEHGVDACDPARAIPWAAQYLVDAYEEFGSWELALAAYNAGPQAVRDHQGIPPYQETERYVPTVMGYWEEYQELYPEGGLQPDTAAGPGGSASCPPEVRPKGGTETYPRNADERARDAMETATLKRVRDSVLVCFGRGTHFSCYDRRDGVSWEHPRGRACDFGIVPIGTRRATGPEKAFGDALANWLVANHQQLGIIQVLWDGRMWMGGGWRAMSCAPNCGITVGHHDHVHVSVRTMPGDPPHASCDGYSRCNP